ncbi:MULTISPECIES: L-threonylcarbamoyladenylate synthase [Bacillaceae]|uniref:Threonylcarbamoyl-AMP synthase n=1 Tax=Evansella alkalicola TaxID=745819 RepID=A0ABS6K2B0_9BACI|nr:MULTISPECIES: L-threonylcarbamoyladenylate synthase [Bacillaceae]MBU9724364.1 threonylcarbamoyl-AMP synthase [Bacillus alkalicola]
MHDNKTEVISVEKDVENLSKNDEIEHAAKRIIAGEVVAFPTETVYGLGGNALSDKAIERIYEAKGRPSDNPLIVHIANMEQLSKYVEKIPSPAQKLMEAFWPGPLTIVLEHSGNLSPRVTANLSTVAVRMPDHPIALALIKASDIPLAAPSANTSGKPSPTTADHVYHDLNGRIPLIIDGGPTGVGVESTVVDCSTGEVIILRPGGVTKEQLEEVVGQVSEDPALYEKDLTPKSPGMKYTHYAPSAPLVLVDGGVDFFHRQVEEGVAAGKKVGVMVTEDNRGLFLEAHQEVVCGKRTDLSTVAQRLYESLRAFDKNNVDIIYSEVFPETAIGSAIMNRLRKAAGGQVIKE